MIMEIYEVYLKHNMKFLPNPTWEIAPLVVSILRRYSRAFTLIVLLINTFPFAGAGHVIFDMPIG